MSFTVTNLCAEQSFPIDSNRSFIGILSELCRVLNCADLFLHCRDRKHFFEICSNCTGFEVFKPVWISRGQCTVVDQEQNLFDEERCSYRRHLSCPFAKVGQMKLMNYRWVPVNPEKKTPNKTLSSKPNFKLRGDERQECNFFWTSNYPDVLYSASPGPTCNCGRICHTPISHWLIYLGYIGFEFTLLITFGAETV